MKSLLYCALVVWVLCLDKSLLAAGPPRSRAEPLKGVVTSGLLLTIRCDTPLVYASVTPLNQDTPAREIGCTLSNWLKPCWHVGSDAFWVAAMFSFFAPERAPSKESLYRYELAELLKGRTIPTRGAAPGKIADPPFSLFLPGGRARDIGSVATFSPLVYSDCLPAGRLRARQFVLTNIRVPSDRYDLPAKDRDRPLWSFTAYGYDGNWDGVKREWREGDWIKEESIEVGFKEPFQALGQGSDYYFLTASGKLYRAPKAAKGKRRPLLPVWTDAKRPIAAHITDADAGRTFLFVKPASPREKPTLFALSPRPRPETYDPALVVPPKVDEPLRSVLRYARILVARKKIKPK